ncbi:2-dehydropantoate 2-reductase [Carnobacteriaceae bacterium zg-ZUI78]|nr:2-dehydropantoate 2-reductase [Carnobacteriaceae bacterium zg-ZUI78]
MKFAIFGAGALGCRIGYQLMKAGENVTLVDTWKDHVEKIKKSGLYVDYNGIEECVPIPIYYPEEVTNTFDVIIPLTKSMALENVLKDVKTYCHQNTRVISLLNGLGHHTIFEKYIPKENIVLGTTIWTAQLKEAGHVLLHGVGNITLQNAVLGDTLKESVEQIVHIFNQANLNAQYSDNVMHAIWKKACVNCCSNAATALLECNLGEYLLQENGKEVVRHLTEEFVEVARTQNIDFDLEELLAFVLQATLKVKDHYTSMYQDLVKNRRLTEIDYLNGYIAKLGKQNNISVPYNDFITKLMHLKEVILDAK